MKVTNAVDCFINYHKINSKKNTTHLFQGRYKAILVEFGGRELESITSDEILSFLNRLTKGNKQTTK